jgi:hypothetical protein
MLPTVTTLRTPDCMEPPKPLGQDQRETRCAATAASTAPSIITNGNATNIAVQGPNHSLHLYWAVNGTPGWNPSRSLPLAPPTQYRR